MKFKLEITCDSVAFEDGELFPEISRILHRLTQEQFGVDLTVYDGPLTLRDINGARVGIAEFVNLDE